MNHDDFKRMNSTAVEMQHEAIGHIRQCLMEEFPQATGKEIFGAYTMAPLMTAIHLIVRAKNPDMSDRQVHDVAQMAYLGVCNSIEQHVDNAVRALVSQN